MNILIFEYHNFGIEDVKECFKKNGHLYKVVETDLFRNRVSAEFAAYLNKIMMMELMENSMIVYLHLITARLF